MGRVQIAITQSNTCIKYINKSILVAVFITLFIGIMTAVAYPSTAISLTISNVAEVKVETNNNENINHLITKYANKYNVPRESLYNTIRVESGGTFDTSIQSKLKYKWINKRWLKRCPGLKIGDREKSYGLAQIHICDHDVTIKQATDPNFALDFMAKNFALGNQRWWMGYKKI